MNKTLIPVFLIFSTIVFFSTTVAGKSHKFSEKLSPEKLGFKHEKLTHLNFFFHDIVTGQNPTAVRVAEAAMTNTSKTLFGSVMIIDDPLTEGPEMESNLVGRAQGMYASAGQNEPGLLMAMTFHFVEGKFNGSNLSFLGRNSVFSEVRELPIVGGSGLFRFARGYAEARTRTLDMKTGNAVVEYNVYVFHY